MNTLSTLLVILSVITPLWLIYWLLVRPAVCQRLRFEIEAVLDEAKPAAAAGKGKDADAAAIIIRRALNAKAMLPHCSMLEAALTRQSKEDDLRYEQDQLRISEAGPDIRKLNSRLVLAVVGTVMAASPFLSVLCCFFGACLLIAVVWFKSVRDRFQRAMGRLVFSQFCTPKSSSLLSGKVYSAVGR